MATDSSIQNQDLGTLNFNVSSTKFLSNKQKMKYYGYPVDERENSFDKSKNSLVIEGRDTVNAVKLPKNRINANSEVKLH